MFFIPIVLKEITNHKAIANLAEKKLLIASYTKAYNALQSLRTHKNATPNSYFLALYLSFKNLEEVIRDRFR